MRIQCSGIGGPSDSGDHCTANNYWRLIRRQIYIRLFPRRRHGPLPCDCLGAEGLPHTETQQAWLVASRIDEDRGGSECCWVLGQVRQQGGPTEFVPERIEDSRVWWSGCYWKNRKAVVVRAKIRCLK